jgi:hypothetical protein
MFDRQRTWLLLMAAMVLALANWACCGSTSPSRDFPEATTVVLTESNSVESGSLPGEPSAEPTSTPSPPEPTVDVSDCTLGATFQADITIPDNTPVEAGQSFVKTWRVRNTGTCDWGPGYRLTFIDGEQMGGAKPASVPDTPAGESAEVSIELVAPVERGQHRGSWQMCVNETECFGDALYVQIVSRLTPIPPDSTALINCLECAKAYPYLVHLRSEPGTSAGTVVGGLRHVDEVTVIDAFWHISESRWWYQVEGYDMYTERVSEHVIGWLPEENVTTGDPDGYPLGPAWTECEVCLEVAPDIVVWDRARYYNGRGRGVGSIAHDTKVEISDREWDPEDRIWFYKITGPDYESGETITGWLDGVFLVLAPPP